MMQASASTNSRSPFGFLLILALLGIIGVMAYNILANQTANTVLAIETTTVDGVEVVVEDGGWSHRTREHAEDVPTIEKCLKGNYFKMFYRVNKSRAIRVCLIEETGDVIFQVLDKRFGQLWEQTAYVKDELHTINQFKEWMFKANNTPLKNIGNFVK